MYKSTLLGAGRTPKVNVKSIVELAYVANVDWTVAKSTAGVHGA